MSDDSNDWPPELRRCSDLQAPPEGTTWIGAGTLESTGPEDWIEDDGLMLCQLGEDGPFSRLPLPPAGKKWVYVWPRASRSGREPAVERCMRLVDVDDEDTGTDVLLVGFVSRPEPPGPGQKWVFVSERVVKLVAADDTATGPDWWVCGGGVPFAGSSAGGGGRRERG